MQDQVIGASRGGWSTKIVALADAPGDPVRFQRPPGQHVKDVKRVAILDVKTDTSFTAMIHLAATR